ncbi:hypothetical protein QBC35DRAFT_78319 [Podospora australis]|uniref:CFEM domain-containing protein n=1 Tax=Podospora australis TaxID=1536484 RepID=A0AAN6WM77_9PEZI|nr:hypothetical protein QBC35DRAFT_78319 [Podospora australis]
MKYFTALLAAAVAVSAHEGGHTLADYVPECSLKCLSDARKSATTCASDDDLKCFCILENYRAIYDAGTTCVLQDCGQDVAIGEVLPAVMAMCEEVLPLTTTITDDGSPTPRTSSPAGAASSAASAATSAATSEATGTAAEEPAPSGTSGANSIAAGLIAVAAPLAIAALL